MERQQLDLHPDATLSQKVVHTLSRLGVGAGEVCDIVRCVHKINKMGMYKEDIPEERQYIINELFKDGIIDRDTIRGKVIYLERDVS